MPLQLNDKKLIPAPFVNLQQQGSFAADGSPINRRYSLSVQGTILPDKGSPRSNGWYTGPGEPTDENFVTEEDKFNSILKKQELIKEAFSATGYKFSYSPPGLDPVECYPKLTSINFVPGNWVIKCDYTLELETDSINKIGSASEDIFYGSGYSGLNLTEVSDDYQIRERDDGSNVIEVTRTISAASEYRYTAAGPNVPWENARTWVLFRKNSVPFTSGLVSINSGILYNTGVFNFIEDESINQLGGRYSLTQSFIFHNQNYIDNRQISRTFQRNLLGDGGPNILTISVNGNIQGLDANNDVTNKLVAASSHFASLTGTLGPLVGAVGLPISYNWVEDTTQGAINYNFEFVNNSGQYYKHSYDVSYTLNNGDNPTVSINGNIEGYTPSNLFYGAPPNYNKFDNALSGWRAVSGSIKSLAFQYYPDLTSSGSLFSNSPLSQNISFNPANGTISYNIIYAYTSGTNTNYQHNYTIDINTDNAASPFVGGLFGTVTINGQIAGLQTDNNPESKLANAKSGWNTIRSTLYPIASGEFSLIGTNTPPLSSGFVRKTFGLDQRGGTLSYSVTFNNLPYPTGGIVAIEDVTVEDVAATDLFAIQLIPGRLSGPIIQNIASTNEKRRNINVNLTLYPKTSAPYYYTYTDKSSPAAIASGIISGLVPNGTRTSGYWFSGDSESWNWKGGLYSRSVQIIFT